MVVERTPIEWLILPLKKYAQFSGRAPRAEYWWFAAATMLVGVISDLIDYASGSDTGTVGLVTSFVLLIPTLAVTVRRLHDIGRTGWWLLVAIVPAALFAFYAVQAELAGTADTWEPSPLAITSILAFCVICFVIFIFTLLRGTDGENRFGPDPYGQQENLVQALS